MQSCWTENQIHIDQVVWCVCVCVCIGRGGVYAHMWVWMWHDIISHINLSAWSSLPTHETDTQEGWWTLVALFPGSAFHRFSVLQVTESWVGPGNEASLWFTTASEDTISEKYTHSENQFINHSGMVVRHSSIPHNWDSIQNNSKQLCILGGGFQALLVFHSTYT